MPQNIEISNNLKIKTLTDQDWIKNINERTHSQQQGYYAMFSTWHGGVTLNPHLMMVPIDDHQVHRGDAVFEAIKTINRKVFLLNEHIDRLILSARNIGIELPMTRSELTDIIMQTLTIANKDNTIIRLFLSRGPGGFTTNPYESIGSQIYIVITAFKSLSEEKYTKGVKIGRSQIPIKEDWLATTKTCNYLPNVMMKKEAVDRGLDFTINFDRQNLVGESSTENIAIIHQNGNFIYPKFDSILKGTTLMAVAALAGQKTRVEMRSITEDELINAKEIFMIGTTLDVLPVVQYEQYKIANSQVGPMAVYLREQLKNTQQKSDFLF